MPDYFTEEFMTQLRENISPRELILISDALAVVHPNDTVETAARPKLEKAFRDAALMKVL